MAVRLDLHVLHEDEGLEHIVRVKCKYFHLYCLPTLGFMLTESSLIANNACCELWIWPEIA